jgi:hypothetical protein
MLYLKYHWPLPAGLSTSEPLPWGRLETISGHYYKLDQNWINRPKLP